MLIPVHLVFVGQLVFFADECFTRPSKGHHRRQADSSTHPKFTRNVIPIIPSDYDLPGLQLIQNKELLYPTNSDGKGNIIYFPPNAHNDGKRDDEMLSNLKEVRDISDLIGKERKTLQREQRKQPKPEELEPCGHFQKNDYNMLTNIIGKMSPEARNALIDALLKTLMDKSKVSAVKSNDNKFFQRSLDAALQPPLRVNPKPEGPLVQPFSLTVEREKLRDLYKYLNNEKLRNGLKKTNVMVNLGELLQETIKKECNATKKPPCCHKQNTTKSYESEATTTTESTTSSMSLNEETDNSDEVCNYGDQYSDAVPSSILDFPGDKVINLTQIFNVHPKLLIVNTGPLAPTDIAGLLNETSKPEPEKSTTTPSQTTLPSTTTTATMTTTTTIVATTASTNATMATQSNPTQANITPAQPVATTIMHTPTTINGHYVQTRSMNNHRKCTRRQFCRHGYRYRYDRRGHISPIQDLVYTYYVDMDDLPTVDD